MRHGNLTRKEAIEIVGIEAVMALDNENCEQTGRLQTDGDADIEWSADIDTNEGRLIAYYYTTPEDMEMLEAADGDGSAIN